MDIKTGFARALRLARDAKGLTQEDFCVVSSRTYVSTLERGLKSPTLEKVEDLAGKLEIHPLTLLALAYLQDTTAGDAEKLLNTVMDEVTEIV